ASATVHTKTTEAIATRWPASPHPLVSEIPFSSARKWSACAFAGGDVPGIVAIGAAPFLRDYLRLDAAGALVGWDELVRVSTECPGPGLRSLLAPPHPAPAPRPPFDDDATAKLPAGMRALGLIALRDELRGEAADTLGRFIGAGVAVKIISGDDP